MSKTIKSYQHTNKANISVNHESEKNLLVSDDYHVNLIIIISYVNVFIMYPEKPLDNLMFHYEPGCQKGKN